MIDPYCVAKAMEGLETWVSSDPEFKSTVMRLIAHLKAMDPEVSEAFFTLEAMEMDDLIRVLAYMEARASVHLMDVAGDLQPGFVGDVLMRSAEKVESTVLAQKEGESGTGKKPGQSVEGVGTPDHSVPVSRVVLDRLLILARANCFDRLFGPDRRRQVLQVLRDHACEI